MKIGGSTAWRSITQPISDRSFSDALAGLRHVELANSASVPSRRSETVISPMAFRLRLVIFTEQTHHAYRHLRGRLPCAVKAFGPHRASEYALHLSRMAFGLLGVLLEGPLGNRHRQPTPASATQNRPMTGLHPSSDCSSARFKALSCPLLIRGKCIFFIFGTICYISPEIAI